MPIRFDPYHKWLGIPHAEQPPHFYRLLGVELFESDLDVISNAADQRMGLLKTFATSDHGSVAEDLLDEVARARVCLLNPAKKLAYDSTLRDMLGHASSPGQVPEGIWLPPLTGIADALDVSCPRCGEEAVCDLTPLPRFITCRHCNNQMRLPGSEEVAAAAARFAKKSAHSTSQSSAEIPIGSIASPKPSVTRQETPRFTGSIQATRENEPRINLPQNPPVSDFKIVVHRRKTSKRSPISFLFQMLFGGFLGLTAGYFVLCVIDINYDFLHLIAHEKRNTGSAVPDGESVPIPNRNHPLENPKPSTQRVPQFLGSGPVPGKVGPLDKNRMPAVQPKPKRNRLQPVKDPFANLPHQMPLPAPHVLDSPVSLTAVPLEKLDNFELAIIAGGSDHVDQLSLTRQPRDKGPSPWTWSVSWNGDPTSEVATFSVIDDQLVFTWSDDRNESAVSALRNSILKIRANRHDHFVALRSPLKMPPMKFELDKIIDRVIFDCVDLPEVDNLRVDINLKDCPRYQTEGAGLRGMKLNDETILRYADAREATTTIKITVFKGQTAIEVRTHYWLLGREENMILRNVNHNLEKLRMSAALPDHAHFRNELQSLERVAALATNLHESARMKYRFYCLVDQYEVELASAQ